MPSPSLLHPCPLDHKLGGLTKEKHFLTVLEAGNPRLGREQKLLPSEGYKENLLASPAASGGVLTVVGIPWLWKPTSVSALVFTLVFS